MMPCTKLPPVPINKCSVTSTTVAEEAFVEDILICCY